MPPGIMRDASSEIRSEVRAFFLKVLENDLHIFTTNRTYRLAKQFRQTLIKIVSIRAIRRCHMRETSTVLID